MVQIWIQRNLRWQPLCPRYTWQAARAVAAEWAGAGYAVCLRVGGA